MRVTKEKLHQLISNKMHKAGLSREHADIAADVLVWADLRAIHSHGAMRVEYYSERISKGGITTAPNITWNKTAPSIAVLDGDNACGLYLAKIAMDEAIKMAKEVGVAVVGVRRMSHSGALGYFVEQATDAGMVAISVCQSDPMVVPFGGSQEYYGTNPIAFGAPSSDGRNIIFDMATTVQAWGKILHARSKKESIPPTWAVDADGNPTTDTSKVEALLPISGPKGYGLMMMVDILSGVLLGVPFGKHVSSMYADLSKGRNLGHLHIVLNPEFFGNTQFKQHISQTINELKQIKPAPGFNEVYYPGENRLNQIKEYEKDGIEIVDDIYNYLVSDDIHFDRYDGKNKFAE